MAVVRGAGEGPGKLGTNGVEALGSGLTGWQVVTKEAQSFSGSREIGIQFQRAQPIPLDLGPGCAREEEPCQRRGETAATRQS